LNDAIARVRAICPKLYKTDRNGDLLRTIKGSPRRSNKALQDQLARVKDEIEQETGVMPNVPLTSRTRKPTSSTKFWAEYKDLHPFLCDWIKVEELSKLLQFFTNLKEEKVHPDYTVLVRTGRTSCRGPNVQQIPKSGSVRQVFVPSQGHLL